MNKVEKCSTTQSGRVVIHKEDNEKRIYNDELDSYKSMGWEVGISDKHRKSLGSAKIGNVPWNKGTKGVMKSNSGTFKKGQPAWNKGLRNVCSAWNKGKTKESDSRVREWSAKLAEAWNNEQRRKNASERMRQSQIGRKLPPDVLERFLSRSYETKKRNKSFNTSRLEESYYKELCETFGVDNVKRQYRDKERYPFRCDFYIVSEDLFIECNFHWTHGGTPFNPDDSKCIAQLDAWKKQAEKSEYFRVAIDTWTHRDVEKLRIARENRLNYKVIY